jgi:ribulose-bisphosphate carboxylase large chain
MAKYEVTTHGDGWGAAVRMAMEQSAAAMPIGSYFDVAVLAPSLIRVRSVRPCMVASHESAVFAYHLNTPTYSQQPPERGSFLIELAVPLSLLANKPAQLWNILVGELPRLGFLSRFRLVEARLPDTFGPGPGYGVDGIRTVCQQVKGPLLCRSMRPAVGLDRVTMARLNRDVLIGGFHMVKDDELQVFADLADFEQHLIAMIAARDEAIQLTGEKKLYFANMICEPWELLERWELCCRLGVDGVLIAPWIQGLGTLSFLARQRRMLILAHNTLGELFTRHPDWGVDDRVVSHWLRVCGADLYVTPGNFGEAGATVDTCSNDLSAARDRYGIHAGMLPILQGGKNPIELPQYRSWVGSDDFMLIVASWVDHHPQGLIAGARVFRAALTA